MSPFTRPLMLESSRNVRVTYDNNPQNDRSESTLVVNPLNPQNMVGASKRFTDPPTYKFSLAAVVTFDHGDHWVDAAPLQLLAGWAGTSDPALAFDAAGNVYLVALPFNQSVSPLGIAVYTSTDGGMTWGPPNLIHSSLGDDKQDAASDLHPLSPFYGSVYTAWDDGSTLRFARTSDGVNWRGVGNNPPGAGLEVVQDSFSPQIAVTQNGDVFVVWRAGTSLKFVKSTDGGDSFSAFQVLASGITPLGPPLAAPDGFPELPGGKFRVVTIPTVCAGSSSTVVVAWADLRETDPGGNRVSRIYFQRTADGGQTWGTSPSGQPLFHPREFPPVFWLLNQHHFHPQLAGTPGGNIGCAFYKFGPQPPDIAVVEPPPPGSVVNPPKIDVLFRLSEDDGQSFPLGITVTDEPWDPALDAPLSHGDPNTTFIGDYFGLAVSSFGYFPFWTDTRTGVQELFTSRVRAVSTIVVEPGLVNFLIGSTADGPLWRLTPHGIVPVPPWGPEIHDREGYAEQTRAAIAKVADGFRELRGLNQQFEGKVRTSPLGKAAGR